jgi:hypothetical protein
MLTLKTQFFGDSYDVVKRFLLQSLAPNAEWAAFPMFTHDVTASELTAYEAFLGLRVVSPLALTASTDRADHLSALAGYRFIFLDPDTGISIKLRKGERSVKYVFASEVVALCLQDVERLLLVFDQSVPRGGEHKAIADKLAYFRERRIAGFAYLSHACFVVLSASASVCEMARANLISCHLPTSRLIGAGNP